MGGRGPADPGRGAGGGRRDASAAGIGAHGEALAAVHLEGRGLRILSRNWRSGRGELDLVVADGEVVAFVEVKTRRPGPQAPLEALSRGKRREIRRTAEAWIHAHPGLGREFRFDVVGVSLSRGAPPSIEHVRGAFRGEDC